ncbi:MAG TPA: hypothetical protein VLG13_02525 [Patescibacteria group bacterium]|nr:hypothetical protein [Patescibacteria group bacterium]
MSNNVYHLPPHGGESTNDSPDFSSQGLGAFVTLLMTNDAYAEHIIAASAEQ